MSLMLVDQYKLEINRTSNISIVWDGGITSYSLEIVDIEFGISSTRRS